LKFSDSVAYDLNGMDKADAVRVDGCMQCRLMHQVAKGVMSNQ